METELVNNKNRNKRMAVKKTLSVGKKMESALLAANRQIVNESFEDVGQLANSKIIMKKPSTKGSVSRFTKKLRSGRANSAPDKLLNVSHYSKEKKNLAENTIIDNDLPTIKTKIISSGRSSVEERKNEIVQPAGIKLYTRKLRSSLNAVDESTKSGEEDKKKIGAKKSVIDKDLSTTKTKIISSGRSLVEERMNEIVQPASIKSFTRKLRSSLNAVDESTKSGEEDKKKIVAKEDEKAITAATNKRIRARSLSVEEDEIASPPRRRSTRGKGLLALVPTNLSEITEEKPAEIIVIKDDSGGDGKQKKKKKSTHKKKLRQP